MSLKKTSSAQLCPVHHVYITCNCNPPPFMFPFSQQCWSPVPLHQYIVPLHIMSCTAWPGKVAGSGLQFAQLQLSLSIHTITTSKRKRGGMHEFNHTWYNLIQCIDISSIIHTFIINIHNYHKYTILYIHNYICIKHT